MDREITEFEKYFTGILDGKIIACEKMKRISEILLDDFYSPGEFHFDYTIAKKHTDFSYKWLKQPSGELGKPLKLELFQKARLQAIFGFVDDNDKRRFNEVLIIEGRKNGKALALDTDIPTPNGFVKMKDVSVDDYVYGADGKPHLVTCVSEVFKNHDCYKVTFHGGYSVVCDAEHIWTVKNRKGNVTDKTTEQMLHYFKKRKDGKGTEYLYRVPMTKPVEYSEKILPLDPYTLGIWLGDGSSRDPRITVFDDDMKEIIENIESNGHKTKIYYNKNRAKSIGVDVVGRGKENPTLTALRKLDLIENKHIPDIYLSASVDQRTELLCGLMDTDGYCSKDGECEFSQKNEKMVDQFRQLLSSLGIVSSKKKKVVTLNGKKFDAYIVSFFCDKTNPCFKIKRKASRLKDHLNKRMQWNSIIGIEKIDSVDCKCISVDSDDHLYLATKNYICTHNTTETSGVELDMLTNDKEGAPQIYNVATMLDQAKLGFNACYKMVRQSPVLKSRIKKRTSDLYYAKNMGFIKALASNSNSLDGLDTHCAVIDELAAIKNRDIYDLIKQSMGARSQPLLFTITTNGFIRNGIFDAQYEYAKNILEGKAENRRFLPFIYELDSPDEWDKEECWIKANPGLGTIKSVDYLREMVQKAKDDPSFKPTVMVKDFNIPQTSESAWLRYEELNNEETFDINLFDYGIGGFDAADTTDLNAAKLIFMRPNDDRIYVESMYWIPEEVIKAQNERGDRKERDNVPYSLWIDQGYMRTCPGNKCEKRIFLEWFKEMREKHDIYTMFIGYDPWHIDDTLLREFKAEFGEQSMIPVRQGVITLSEPMKNLAADFKAHKVVYQNNPVDKWCLINTEVKTDVNGNIQPKKSQDQRKRIDGTAALLDAYVVLQDKKGVYLNMNKGA